MKLFVTVLYVVCMAILPILPTGCGPSEGMKETKIIVHDGKDSNQCITELVSIGFAVTGYSDSTNITYLAWEGTSKEYSQLLKDLKEYSVKYDSKK